MTTIDEIRSKYEPLSKVMDERTRRLWAAAEAEKLGRSGVTVTAKATGMARTTITRALAELGELRGKGPAPARLRRAGAGRKGITESQPGILRQLESLVDASTRGDPMSPLRWTCKSIRTLADELSKKGYQVKYRKVAYLLYQLGYSLQANRKIREGTSHPDRNAQFEYINRQVTRFQAEGLPVISVDTKKKELIGDFRNSGEEWMPAGKPEEVQVHDFAYPELGKGIPYGVYDIGANQGWVSVGTDHDTAEFAVETIRRWWKKMGKKMYPQATRLMITADGGGSNASRSKLWKRELSQFAKESGLRLSVCHFPPGTSKWNRIEHRMFCHITQNWRGRPLLSHQVMVNLIASTRTRKGLKIKAELDNGTYEPGIHVSKQELEALQIKPAKFHGDWNYDVLF